MKNIMRRTVALMLMACLLLSVFPAVSLAADAASNSVTYNFVSTDGNEYATSAGNSGYEKYETLTAGQSFGNWSWLTAHASADTCVTTENINGNMGTGAGRYIAVKLSGIPDAGTYNMTFTCPSDARPVDVYIMPGDYTITSHSQVPAYGTLIGKIADGTTTTLSATLTDDHFGEDGGVILVFRGNSYTGSGARFRCSQLVMTRTSWTYNFVSGEEGVSYTQGSNLTAGQKFPKDVNSWSWVVSHASANTIVADSQIHGNINSAGRFIAVEIYGLPGAGDYEMAFTCPTNAVAVDVYLMPGDYSNSSHSQVLVQGTLIGKISDGATTTYTVSLSENHIGTDGGVTLVFRGGGYGSSGVRFRCSQLEVKAIPPKVAQVGDTQYTSVSEAIIAAGTDGIVALIASTEETVTVSDGVTLDLAGNTLTGNVIVSSGNIIDSATDSADTTTLGGIVGTVQVQTTNTYLPLKDGTTWRFFQYALATYEAYEDSTEGDVEFWFDIDITNAMGYALLSTDSSAAGLKITAALSWSGAAEGSVEVGFKSDETDIVAGWAAAEQAEEAGKEAGMYLSVTGIPANTTVSVVPVLESTAGVKCNFGTAATYPAA